jgi:MYXO-CTERM domain-containing protein
MVRALFVTLLLASSAFASSIVTNGGFETGDFTGWSLTGNPCTPSNQYCGVSSASDPNFPIPVYSGTYAAYFGPVGADTYLDQTLSLAPSTTYTLTFSLDEFISPDPAHGYVNFVGVSVDGSQLFADGNMANTGGYEQESLIFSTAPSGNSGLLQFAFRNDLGYFFLDDVSVTSSPEPASWLLLLSGLALAFLYRDANLRKRTMPQAVTVFRSR